MVEEERKLGRGRTLPNAPNIHRALRVQKEDIRDCRIEGLVVAHGLGNRDETVGSPSEMWKAERKTANNGSDSSEAAQIIVAESA
jgi:hypothetical protein